MVAYKRLSFFHIFIFCTLLFPLNATAEQGVDQPYPMPSDQSAQQFAISITNAAKTFVLLEPPRHPYRVSSVEVVAEEPRDKFVPERIQEKLQKRVDKGMYENGIYSNGPFERGGELKASYTIIQYTRGERRKRWWFGGAFWYGTYTPGLGSMGVEVKYFDPAGRQLSRILVEAQVGDHVFMQRYQDVINWVAQDIIDYTSATFGYTKNPAMVFPPIETGTGT